MQPRHDLPPVAKRRRWLCAVALLAALASVMGFLSPARAALLAEDLFLTSATPTGPEYAVATAEGQNPANIGFSSGWFTSSGTSASISATSLNYSDGAFPAETGGKLLSPTSDSRVHRLLGSSNPFQATDSGTVYMSMLLQTGTNNGYRAFEMHNGGTTDASHRTLQLGLHNGGDFPLPNNFGFRVNNNGTLEYSLGVENANVNLFLLKFVLSTANNGDTITVWQNPSLANLLSDPVGGVTSVGLNFAADRLGIGHFGGTAIGLDELRIGTSLQDVLTNVLTCDINGNGVCNSTDTNIISQHMYLAGTFAQGDIDGSGVIDFDDYRLFKYHPARVIGFDPGDGSGSSIPEPAAAILVLAAIMCAVNVMQRRRLVGTIALLLVMCSSHSLQADPVDLLNDPLNFSGKTLNLRPWAQLPAGFNDMIAMTTRPDDIRNYVVAQEGTIFRIEENSNGTTQATPWFNAASALQSATGRTMNGTDGQRGLQSVAFHPDFGDPTAAGYGKLYTTMLENRPANPADPSFFYLGNSTYGNGGGDGVLAEWTFDHNSGQVNSNSYRELFRVNMANFDHPIKQAKFNPYAEPGDEDYGLLYMTHGDSNNQDSLGDDPQDRGDLMGKMIRINPLQAGASRYTIPESNPFFGGSNPSPAGTSVLGEVYAYGFRNPHTYSFNLDDAGNTQILVGDIGRSNMEEVNLVEAGGNYGWTKREGTFVHLQGNNYPPNPSPNAGYVYGVAPLPANEATVGVGPDGNRYIYPVAQYDHNGPTIELGEDFTASAVASGHVIRNGSDPALDNQLVFFNFAFNHGDVYHTDFDAMLNAVTQLDPADPTRDQPGELTQATVQRFHLTLDHDNNPATPAQTADSLNTLLGVFRNDSRVGEGVSGEMFLTNKNNNLIYLVTNTVPEKRLTLTVDRGTGAMTIGNGSGTDVAVDRVSVFSPSGSFVPSEFETLGVDWATTGAHTARALTQASATSPINFTGATTAALGDAFEGQLVGFGEPVGEDVQFVYWTDGPAGRSFAGDVVYTGVSTVPITIVLTVDVASGATVMLNQTPFAQEIEGYTIASAAGSLSTVGWNSLDEQGVEGGDWIASPALATRVTEFQEDGTTTFDDATPFDLGQIFEAGATQDLVLEFLIAGEESLREGMVVYVLAGDFNGDDVVDAADYTVWRDNLNTENRLTNDLSPGSVGLDDYAIWKNNFGAALPGAGGSTLAVPETGSLSLVLLGVLVPLAFRQQRASL